MKHMTVVFVLGLSLLLLAACAEEPAVESSAGEIAAVAAEATVDFNLPQPEILPAMTVTPAPSGFVPGDTLPTLPTLPTPTLVAAATADSSSLFREIEWGELVPPGYRPEDILAKYQPQLDAFPDGDPAAMDLYLQMQEEFNNAPINTGLNQVAIKLPGFIAPLEFEGELITEFLLVPYFGACIHVPPPPVNQTVHVALSDGEGITFEESYYPVWVQGTILAEGMDTDIGNAGYRIQNAVLTPYEYPTG